MEFLSLFIIYLSFQSNLVCANEITNFENDLSCKKYENCLSSDQLKMEENFALNRDLTSAIKIYKEQGFVLLQASTLEEAKYLIEQVI